MISSRIHNFRGKKTKYKYAAILSCKYRKRDKKMKRFTTELLSEQTTMSFFNHHSQLSINRSWVIKITIPRIQTEVS